MSRSARPDDLTTLRVPLDPRPSPDGRRICFVRKEPNPDLDGYRSSLWLVDAEGDAPARQLTLGRRRDTSPRWSPDGRTIAFLSDRAAVLAKGGAGDRPTRETEAGRAASATDDDDGGAVQVWLLPVDGGEATQLTRLPEDVDDLAWSPDGQRLCLVSTATTAERRAKPRTPEKPRRDARLIDRLQYQLNGAGFIHDKAAHLWVVEVGSGVAQRITSGEWHDEQPAWSPDGARIAFVSDRHPARDLGWRSDVYLVDASGGPVTRVTGGRGDRTFQHPAWAPDGSSIAAIGHRFPRDNGSVASVWVFPPESGQDGTDLTRASGLEVEAGLNSDLVGVPSPGLTWGPDGSWIVFGAPIDGSCELWRVRLSGDAPERLTEGRHAITAPHGVPHGRGLRLAVVLGDGTTPWSVACVDVPAPGRRASGPLVPSVCASVVPDAWSDIALVAPVERWHEVDGRRIQGWFLGAPRRDGRPAPVVVEIHGGPATLYGWALMWEWQCLVAAGISVYACNPRGSQGYGEDFCAANIGDWGPGPMADVMGGVDALIADGLVDADRMGVTGGSYGGYLTAWIIGHTDRFRAAVSCRGVYDLTSQMLSGDIGGPTFGRYEFGVNPWQDPELYLRHSPLTYADRMRTPLLIQHSERDLRCPITQAEELFSTLRSLRREVRLMRVPGESHELTRSGAPYRRVENLERIRDWFVHYLVEGRTGLPRV
ncbi:MAG: S9 family peptidase [Chloroflexi bacterium]|nr:S9 family peptidase [Chloroflexota bacterium]